mmetsp:Transcript_5706/g.16015  ORF Transcript_5706/g.16015 Transcript_5706/m.16015 type:complete len:227 (+) Transcript_5706:791-1471(+)
MVGNRAKPSNGNPNRRHRCGRRRPARAPRSRAPKLARADYLRTESARIPVTPGRRAPRARALFLALRPAPTRALSLAPNPAQNPARVARGRSWPCRGRRANASQTAALQTPPRAARGAARRAAPARRCWKSRTLRLRPWRRSPAAGRRSARWRSKRNSRRSLHACARLCAWSASSRSLPASRPLRLSLRRRKSSMKCARWSRLLRLPKSCSARRRWSASNTRRYCS